jgi:hypothetical protein
MRSIVLILFFILCWNQSIGQTTSFKDNRWFDYKKNPSNFYSKPIHQPAEVIVSQDSIIAHLGSNIIRYKIKSVADIEAKNKSTREYKVDKNGTEMTISISRSKETYFGKERRIAWLAGGEDGWIVLVPLTSITPIGYLFPGDPKIDIAAERTRIVGYYDYDLMRRVDAEAYRRSGGSYDQQIWTDDKCKKDVQIEFRPDNTGTWWYGHTAKNCTNKTEQNFKWKLEHVVAEGRQTMMLTIVSDETNEYMIDELTDKKLSLGGQFRIDDKDDTTNDGYLVLSKKKKK